MAEVNIIVDGRTYSVACDDGEERRLLQLGSYVDQRMHQVGVAGTANKTQAMVLASLVLADEVFDLNEKISEVQNQSAQLTGSKIEYQGLSPNEEQNVINLIEQMAAKVERLTARVQRKSA